MVFNRDLQTVSARLGRVVPESRGEECDVLGFVCGDLADAAAHPGREPVGLECLLIVLRERISVECVLKVFECQRELEDINIYRSL